LAIKHPNWHRWMGNLIDRSPGLCIPKRIAQISKMLETRRQPQQHRCFFGYVSLSTYCSNLRARSCNLFRALGVRCSLPPAITPMYRMGYYTHTHTPPVQIWDNEYGIRWWGRVGEVFGHRWIHSRKLILIFIFMCCLLRSSCGSRK